MRSLVRSLLSICAYLLLSTMCGGCATKIQSGLMWAQDGQTLNTQQTCQNGSAVVAAAAKIAEIYSALGVPISREVGVCQIEYPEPCCMGYFCVGPHGPQQQSARKAGCWLPRSLWVTRTGPPICTDAWPAEPGCRSTSGEIDWRLVLIHEVGHEACDQNGKTDTDTKEGECYELQRRAALGGITWD